MVWLVRCFLNDSILVLVGSCYIIDEGMVYDWCMGFGWVIMQSLGFISWVDGLDFVKSLNVGVGYGWFGWWLLNICEFESFIDICWYILVFVEGYFFGWVLEGCWFFIISVYELCYVWVVYMQDGVVGVGYKRYVEFHVWVVRRGV